MSIAEILSLRFQFEETTQNFVIPDNRKASILENIIWFKKYGNRKNRFRTGYDQAIEISNKILKNI